MGSQENPTLPLATSTNLILVPATPLERIEIHKHNGAIWAGSMDQDQYLARENHLKEQALTKNGQITFWILTTTEGRPNDRPVLSSCETLRKIGLVVRPGSSQVEQVITHGICSVFNRPEYRGRGYAGRMMQELGKNLEEGWQQQDGAKGTFSVLYSDIGQKFYSTFGWRPYPSTHISLDPIDEETYKATRLHLNLPDPIDLYAHDLETSICPQDVARTRNHLQHLANTQPPTSSTTYVAINPDYDHMSWHHAREEFVNDFLKNPTPTIKGCTVPSPQPSNPSSSTPPIQPSLIWTRVYGAKPSETVLSALRLILPSHPDHDSSSSSTSASSSSPSAAEAQTHLVHSIASLLLRAQKEAYTWGAGSFELWSPSPLTVAAARMLKKVETEGADIVAVRTETSICSLRWAGGGLGEVEWVGNEKYAWC